MPVATQAMLMEHDRDPREQLIEEAAPFIGDIEPMGRQVLLAAYRRPEKTAGGVYLADGVNTARAEDVYQGKVQLILKVGPLALSAWLVGR